MTYDVVILGAGPAGLSAAIYASRKVLSTLIISKNIGGQVADTWDIENYLGFTRIETADLIKRFDEHVEKYGVVLVQGHEVKDAGISGDIKKITLDNGESYRARTVLISTGKRHRPLNIPGEKEFTGRGIAFCSTCDAPLYAGAEVAVIGGGNSALEAVIDLEKIAKKIFLVSLTDLTGDRILQDKIKNFSKTELFIKHKTLEILGDKMVNGLIIESMATREKKRLNLEGVFVEIGQLPNSELFRESLALNDQNEIKIDNFCRTSVPGVFACGDVTDVPYKQVVIAAGEGAKAALSAYYYLVNKAD